MSRSKTKISGKTDLIARQITAVICVLKESSCGANLNHIKLFKMATKIIKNLDKVAEEALDAIIEAQEAEKTAEENQK